jgi:glycosyltransferase involved in cell wall biosynthesis
VTKATPKVAIVCDWLTNVGGAERVVKSLHELYPNAPIYTSQYVPEKIDWFTDADVRTGWLNRLPKTMHKFFPILRAIYFSHLKLNDYDVVISSTGAEAKAVKTGPETLNISYMHAPTQYYWSLYDQYLERPGFGKLDPIIRVLLRVLVRPMRYFDKRFARRPDYIISNSTYVHDEIKKYYSRESTIIFPPVNTEKFSNTSKEKRSGFIITSRQVPWKRIDLAVKACQKTGEKLTVVGDGTEHESLVALANGSSNITFLPTKNQQGLAELFAKSKGFIFPSLEPFGIAPVEALTAGVPVIAYGKGGALDYVKDGKNGLVFDKQSVGSLVETLRKFHDTTFDEAAVRQSALSFSDAEFKSAINKFVTSHMEKK